MTLKRAKLKVSPSALDRDISSIVVQAFRVYEATPGPIKTWKRHRASQSTSEDAEPIEDEEDWHR